MKILPKSLGAVVRHGDYFVVSNTRHGNTVQYSPDAEPGSIIVGSFGAANGNILYWNADETHHRVAACAGGDVAAYELLCAQEAEREIGIVKSRDEDGDFSPLNLLRMYLQGTEEEIPDFVGTVPELLRLIGAEGLSQYARGKFLRDLCRLYPALVTVSGERRQGRGGGMVITCQWSQIPGIKEPKFKF